MSGLDEFDELERQLADLQMITKVKKVPPAVPPKKKAQPQVPHSSAVNLLREPSYSSKISPAASNNNIPTYSNTMPSNVRSMNKDYANIHQLNISPSHLSRQNLTPLKNYNNTYSNITPYRNNDNEVPPPPPPPPPSIYVPPQNMTFTGNQNPEEYLQPPSPVSSNYSELARATANLNYNQDRSNYPPIYQNDYPEYEVSQPATYESLYEPINPRSHSNLSGHTNNSGQNYHSTSPNPNKILPKEEEVDTLTNLLVKSDFDVLGTCAKCKKGVVGENSGCKAMGNMYHVQCFSCYRCNINLQGKPFYAVEGHPYCETDYYETLEKCSVCNKPILDRILRATGKPYHPTCFTCTVCNKSLDGIPFTVDATNAIYCIEDFHKKFAPRCHVCKLPIMPEEGQEETVRVVALDRSFHVRCYRCEDCGLLFSEEEGRGCYPLDDHILCQTCNMYRIRVLTNVMTTDL